MWRKQLYIFKVPSLHQDHGCRWLTGVRCVIMMLGQMFWLWWICGNCLMLKAENGAAAVTSWGLRTWHGLPSLTRTGKETRRGESRYGSIPFSARALFTLYRWFWNQIFTCVGVKCKTLARCSLSGADKYLCCLKRLSNSNVCVFENRILRLRFFPESSELSLSRSTDSSADSSGFKSPGDADGTAENN